MIIPGIWILAAISKIPRFIKRSRFAKENKSNYCISLLTEEGAKALSTVYTSINSVLLIFLVLLYSKVVYTLWFKHCDDVLTHYQQVCGRTQLGLALESGILNNAGGSPLMSDPLSFYILFLTEELPFLGGASQYRQLREVPPGDLAGL